jgi:hypothetical protein
MPGKNVSEFIILFFKRVRMKYTSLTLLLAACLGLISRAQLKLGDVASVYITTTSLDSSVSVYEKLGFTKTGSGTIPVPWAQVSDGSLLITMRQDADPYMGLAYYSPDPEKRAATLEKEGIVFTQKPKGSDAIKRYYFKSPDGFSIMLANNPGGFLQPTGMTMLNMKPGDFGNEEKYPNEQCGVFGEFCHPVHDLEKSVSFWKKLGFTVRGRMNEGYPVAILTDGLMIIGLHQTRGFDYPAVTYFGINTTRRIGQLKERGLRGFSDFQGPGNVVLKTWEGQHFFLFSMGM